MSASGVADISTTWFYGARFGVKISDITVGYASLSLPSARIARNQNNVWCEAHLEVLTLRQ